MKNQKITFLKILLAIACCAMGSLTKVEGETLPCRFVYNGSIQLKDLDFPGYSDTDQCPSDHTDPGGYFYDHMHPNRDFTFDVIAVINGQVARFDCTAAMSDEAWADYYPDYTMVSGSTTAQNCYSYAVGAPTPMGDEAGSAWYNWTFIYTLCSGATKGTSTLIQGGGHCVVFTESPEGCGYVSTTFEKNASGPVWSYVWNIPFDYVADFSTGNPIGENWQ